MKSQSLPKKLSAASDRIQPEIGQPGWSTFLKPIDQSMPEHSLPCDCKMCRVYEYQKFKQALDTQTKLINSKIKSRVLENNMTRKIDAEQNYRWIIKHLALPTHKIATNGLNIHITQSLFYKDGQPSQLYLNKQIQDPIVKRINRQKLTNAFIQKIMTQRRRKYKEYIRIKSGRKKIQQKKKLLFGQKQVKKQIKDAVLIRFCDGYQQILTQNQFLGMFLKRKQDPIWKQMVSIRNFINITNPQQQKSSYVVVKYRPERIKYQQLFNRSKILIRIYGQYIIPSYPEYINPTEEIQFCQQLQKYSLQMYAEYLMYQIVSFVQFFYDQQISNIVVGIYFDQVGNAFLNQVYKLHRKSLVRFTWTDQIYRKRMDDQSTRLLESKQVTNQSSYQEGAQIIMGVMQQAYQKMRDQYGLTTRNEDNQQQIANNKFFKKIYPNFNQNITDVLKDPNLGIEEFRSKFLGIKEQKKPIVKQFTSNMIKTIHLTSPRLKNSQHLTNMESSVKNNSTIHYTPKKKDNILLSPLKLNSNIKLSTTLPAKQTN